MSQEETLVGVPADPDPLAAQSAADATVRIAKTGQTRLSGRWLTLSRAAWLILAVATIVFFVASIPAYVTLVETPCSGDQCLSVQLTTLQAQALHAAGVSSAFYASWVTVGNALPAVPFTAVALFIFWRRSDDRLGLLASAALLSFATGNDFTRALQTTQPVWQIPIGALSYFGSIVQALFLLTFPDGRFAFRWTRWLAVAWLLQSLIYFFPDSPISNGTLSLIALLALVILSIFTVIQRYRRISDPAQRQQTKWVVYGVTVAIGGYVGVLSVGLLILGVNGQNADVNPLIKMILNPVPNLFLILLPLTIAFSILRSRLWDIDFVINRTLVYGALTVLVLVLFGAALLVISQVFQNVTGGPLVAVAVAAVIFGLIVQPVHLRVQRFVDRRLYGIRINYQRPLPVPIPSLSAQVADPARHTSPQGQQFGSFEAQELIGRGGMAEIYKGRHTSLGKTVAIKVLPSNLVQDVEFRKRFEREARTVAALKHPNIVEVFDFGEADGLPYMVMEYIAGQDIGDFLRASGRLSLHLALPLIQDIAAALDYAHQQGVIHRDIKATNVMLEPITTTGQRDKTHRAVLMDFGIAKIVGGGTRLTQAGMMGTLEYIAPEQIQDSAEVDARADVYAFGVLVYQMLTGALPFPNSNPGALLMAHLQQPAPDARRSVPDIPERVAAALQRALAKAPAERFPSAGAFATALA